MVGIWRSDLNSRGIIGLQYTTCLERRKRIFLIDFIFLGVPMHVTPCVILHHAARKEKLNKTKISVAFR